MVVEAQIGLLHHRILEDGVSLAVWRGRGGWYPIEVGSGAPPGRVRYDSLRDKIHIDSPAGLLEIPFRWRTTMFQWRGRRYQIESSASGRVRIVCEPRPAWMARLHGAAYDSRTWSRSSVQSGGNSRWASRSSRRGS